MIRRIALPQRSRRRTRARDVRWNVQAWAAIATVVAGLMSIPALIISVNALKISEQQRADALTQRAEDQKERAASQARSEADARAVYAQRVSAWGSGDDAMQATIRNLNSDSVTIWVLWVSPNDEESSLKYRHLVPACTEITLWPFSDGHPWPRVPKFSPLEFVLINFPDAQRRYWKVTEIGRTNTPLGLSQVDRLADAHLFTEKHIVDKHIISPCT